MILTSLMALVHTEAAAASVQTRPLTLALMQVQMQAETRAAMTSAKADPELDHALDVALVPQAMFPRTTKTMMTLASRLEVAGAWLVQVWPVQPLPGLIERARSRSRSRARLRSERSRSLSRKVILGNSATGTNAATGLYEPKETGDVHEKPTSDKRRRSTSRGPCSLRPPPSAFTSLRSPPSGASPAGNILRPAPMRSNPVRHASKRCILDPEEYSEPEWDALSDGTYKAKMREARTRRETERRERIGTSAYQLSFELQ